MSISKTTPSPGEPDPIEAAEVPQGPLNVGTNLRALRRQRGLSLDGLARISGVSRAMLGQIETGKSVPTITLLWRIAHALGTSVAALVDDSGPARYVHLPRANATLITSSAGRFVLRPYAAAAMDLRSQLYELRVAPGHAESVQPYQQGTRAALAVVSGALQLDLGDGSPIAAPEGDGILFRADVEHIYSNAGAVEAIAFLVVSRAGGESA